MGTSGWHYRHWVGPFYADAPSLASYARHFDTVEVNNSFYRLPTVEAAAAWHAETPAGFTFAVKASRFLSHLEHLRDPEEPIARMLARTAPLGEKRGPFLLQLPPRWHRDVARLEAFLVAWPSSVRLAIELRDPSWLHPDVYAVMRAYGAAFCIYDLAGFTTPLELTAAWTYVRLHGPAATKYAGLYTDAALARWAADLRALGVGGHVYFDNDQAGYAVRNARDMKSLLT